jgi:hypothetical protein
VVSYPQKRTDADEGAFRKYLPVDANNRNLHVTRDGQFVECQPTLGLHSPEGPDAIKDKRVWDGRILEALSSTPF